MTVFVFDIVLSILMLGVLVWLAVHSRQWRTPALARHVAELGTEITETRRTLGHLDAAVADWRRASMEEDERIWQTVRRLHADARRLAEVERQVSALHLALRALRDAVAVVEGVIPEIESTAPLELAADTPAVATPPPDRETEDEST